MQSSDFSAFHGLEKGSKILLAFSGGVDSTIAAHLCLEAGFEVLACNMRLLPNSDKASEKAMRTADALGVKLEFLDLDKDFHDTVMRYCAKEFSIGRTPNPCAVCNPLFKFGRLSDFARKNGCSALVTGHYAKMFENGILARGNHRPKDQSYFLFGLTDEQRLFSRFPLGAMTKDEVRAIARNLELPNAEAPESQDACFSPENGTIADMLISEFNIKMPSGKFIHSRTGRTLGYHKGVHSYTIGQRKGTGISLGRPVYVKALEGDNVIIADDESEIFRDHLTIRSVNWCDRTFENKSEFDGLCQIRYRSKESPAKIKNNFDGTLEIIFENPQRAVTPGQAAVFYSGDKVVCGGWIDNFSN